MGRDNQEKRGERQGREKQSSGEQTGSFVGWKWTEGVGRVERHKVEKSRERRDRKREKVGGVP